MDEGRANQTKTDKVGKPVADGTTAAEARGQIHRAGPSFSRIAKLYLLKGLRSGPDRIIEIALTVGLFSVAAVQLYTTISNNHGTSVQTDQLISAAKISAYAASQNLQSSRNFADSARGINQGVADAVINLGRQVSLIELTRETSEASSQNSLLATIDTFHADQRAWLAVDSVTAEPFGPDMDKRYSPTYINGSPRPPHSVLEKINVTVKNVGKTPALRTRVELLDCLDIRQADPPIANEERFIQRRYAALFGQKANREVIAAFRAQQAAPIVGGGVIAPNVSTHFSTISDHSKDIPLDGQDVTYLFFRISYYDAFNSLLKRESAICMRKVTGSAFEECPQGNDMN